MSRESGVLALRPYCFVKVSVNCLAEELSTPDDHASCRVFANVDTSIFLPDAFRDFHYPYNIPCALKSHQSAFLMPAQARPLLRHLT